MKLAVAIIIIVLLYVLYKQYKAYKINTLIATRWMLLSVHQIGAKKSTKLYLDYVSRLPSNEADPILKQLCKHYGMSTAWISDEAGGVEAYDSHIDKLASSMGKFLEQFEPDNNEH